MKEIGSEFENKSFKIGKNEFLNLVKCSKKYVLSGRTGLFSIAKELKAKNIYSVALPAYCCFSMIEPFMSLNFNVEYYDDYIIPKSEVVLIMDYFGFLSNKNISYAKRCKDNNKYIIVDATQTAFSSSKVYDYADYIVVSYRKWFDCLCATVYSKDGFQDFKNYEINNEYTNNWRQASILKKKYLTGEDVNKNDFLDLFKLANNQLKNNYAEFYPNFDEINILENVDSSDIIKKRRRNAKILIDRLKKYDVLMFNELHENDCPLFVPLILDLDFKIKLREALIKNKIFCPCHWPIENDMVQCKTKLHEQELSLVCDQRYDENDMLKIIEVFEEVYNNKKDNN